jgi:hypothetical protein
MRNTTRVLVSVFAMGAFLGTAFDTKAGTLVVRGIGNASLQHGVGGKIDITDPDNDNVIDTLEWPLPIASPNAVGQWNGPGNGGEEWTKLFDNHVGPGNVGPWGGNTSKVCCTFTGGGGTFIEMHSQTKAYNLTGYTISSGNDVTSRDPRSWTFEGSNDGGTNWDVLDTVTNHTFPNRKEVWEADNIDNPGGPYASFRFVFTENNGGGFQIHEIEVFGDDNIIPEPSTLVLGLIGMMGLGLFGRRRRRNA